MSSDRSAGQPVAQEWQARLGQSIRDLRVHRNLTLNDVARKAGIESADLDRIESGGGGTIASLVQVAHALGQDTWLEALAPVTGPPSMSPMQRLRERQSDTANKLISGRRKKG